MHLTKVFPPKLSLALAGILMFAAAPVLAQASADWPQWLKDAMAAESSKLPAAKLELADGAINTVLAGELTGEVEPFEGGWYIPLEIGSDSPVECYVYSDDLDTATLTQELARLNIDMMVENFGPLGTEIIYSLDTQAYDDKPYFAVEWLYTVGEAPETMVGLMKVRVARVSGYTFACTHNLLGYRDTFATVFETFVKNASVARGTMQPYYEELYLQKIGPQSLGFAVMSFTLDEDGDTQIDSMDSMLIPVDSESLSTTDTRARSFSRPDGTLINQSEVTVQNGELTTELMFEQLEGGEWQVSGNFMGKPLGKTIATDEVLLSSLGHMRTGREIMNDKHKNGATIYMWVPSADPTQVLPVSLEMDEKRGAEGWGTMTMGPIVMQAQLDKTGSMVAAEMTMGNTDIVIERVWSSGSVE